MVVIHGTRKFLERVGPPAVTPAPTTTALGNWYATVLFWRPQVALFVNEVTLLPVLVPLAPARGVLSRFLSVLPRILLTHGCNATFVAAELEQMQHSVLDKTKSRSVLGIMNASPISPRRTPAARLSSTSTRSPSSSPGRRVGRCTRRSSARTVRSQQ